MSKRNISYVKPQDPSFLRRLKEEIGYKEGPTVDTKRQKVNNEEEEADDEEFLRNAGKSAEAEDEKPQVVVLKEGDLTAEEAEAEKNRLEEEESKKPADLNQRIIFKAKTKPVNEETVNNTSDNNKKDKKSKKKISKDIKSKLSFNDEDAEEDEEKN